MGLVGQRVQANFTSTVDLAGGLAGALSMMETTNVTREIFFKYINNSQVGDLHSTDGGLALFFVSFSLQARLHKQPHTHTQNKQTNKQANARTP